MFQADARVPSTLRQEGLLDSVDAVVISVGTTAFPTAKWESGQNGPKIACLDTVSNILDAVQECRRPPKKIVLVSSIGVERSDSFPFKILNAYGVLGYKLASERLLLERSKDLGYQPIIVRPGRLVGAPFTNSDLAKLLQLTQGSNKGFSVSTQDILAGDVERNDVATAICRLLASTTPAPWPPLSIVNKPGRAPTLDELDVLLSEARFNEYSDAILL